MEEDSDGRLGKVRTLIDKATNSTESEVNPGLLKAIKSVVRSSDSEIKLAVETLMENMKKNHSQVRYLALLIVDELFMRSKLFRSLLVVKFDQFLSLSIGFRRNLPLPAPSPIATRLRSKAIEFLEKWNTSFGIHYRQLRLGFDYLKNTLHLQFPNLQQNAARAQQERKEREIRSKEIILNKFETLRQNVSSIKDEIQTTLEEIRQCLDILHTNEVDDDVMLDASAMDEIEEVRCSSLMEIRLESLRESKKLHESSENKVIFDTLRELYKLLVTKHLISVQEWISVLVRVEPEDTRFRDSTLKEFIDIQNHLKSVKKTCEQSGCALMNPKNNEEEDFWVEGEIEVLGAGSSSTPTKPNKDLASTSTVHAEKITNPRQIEDSNVSERLDGGGEDYDLNPRKKLLSEAPIMSWGSSLYNWESNQDVLANQRGLELEGHWGRVDNDRVIPAEKISELKVQASIYKEEHVDIKPCLAPLRKGGLCQRRDLKICPFHGPIILRDSEGNPINQVPLTEKEPIRMETEEVVRELAEQAVKNVRERDKEEIKKRENDRKILSRAKLAKVREHNETVLRQAAIASTSRSAFVGEDSEGQDQITRSPMKSKKQTLASMLRKKVTTKDRLSQRLLNTRATDATVRQLTIGEDSKYREAYPNQW